MCGKLEWVPEKDPPPDLIVEIEVSRSAVSRMNLFAARRVPEVWRFDGQTVPVHVLQPVGTYQQAEHSPTFPAVPLGELTRFLLPKATGDFLGVMRPFRNWLRQLKAQQNQV
jgi:Uma2 family endonuclease